MLYRGGTLATQGGTLRGALDACLSSPSGRGIVVDESGGLVGSTTAREVLTLIEALPGAAEVPT
jgi:osmoprotectant transport system ATP-binding protein